MKSFPEVDVMEPLKLLAVFPHPDDESLGMGPTLAKYSSEGVETYLLCATRGERGWNGPEDENPGLESLGKIRERELRCAAETLGLHEVTFLDYIDGDVDQAMPQEIISKIVAHIRRIRPQVVVTFCCDGSYGHPDHIALAQFTAAALVCASDAQYIDSSDQPSHRILKFYHMVDSKQLVEGIKQTIGEISIGVDGVERKQVGWEDWAITTCIDAGGYFDIVWKAVLCHQSQLPGYGPFVDLPQETLKEFFSTGNFVRVFSLVNGGRKVEQDLFEGLRESSH
jgi:LmbE family N-acetylglucosaminyl deacetylase